MQIVDTIKIGGFATHSNQFRRAMAWNTIEDFSLKAASFSPSGRLGLACAAYSHSATVGEAFAFCFRVSTGGEPGNKRDRHVQRCVRARLDIAAEFFRSGIVGNKCFTLERCHCGCARTKARKSLVVTGTTSKAKVFTEISSAVA